MRYEDLNLDVCETCRAAPRCAGCELPLAGFLDSGGDYCTRCENSAPRCAACGRPALESYWTIAGVEGVFCADCTNDAPRCEGCSRPCLDGDLRDGRFFCRDCARGAMSDAGAYEAVYERVLEVGLEKLGLEVRHVPVLVVDSRDGITEAGAGEFPGKDLCGLYQRDRLGRSTIRVLSHLSETKVASVLAHELAHAWQVEHCPAEQGTRLREGFAEWVAWKTLEQLTDADADAEREIIEARTDDYGIGFRLFRGIEERESAAAAVRYARSARTAGARS